MFATVPLKSKDPGERCRSVGAGNKARPFGCRSHDQNPTYLRLKAEVAASSACSCRCRSGRRSRQRFRRESPDSAIRLAAARGESGTTSSQTAPLPAAVEASPWIYRPHPVLRTITSASRSKLTRSSWMFCQMVERRRSGCHVTGNDPNAITDQGSDHHSAHRGPDPEHHQLRDLLQHLTGLVQAVR